MPLFQHVFRRAPPTPCDAASSCESQQVKGNGDDVAKRRSAIETIVALSALFGETNVSEEQIILAAAEEHSIILWSSEALAAPKKELLADPVDCPPFTDPSSVVIADAATLEYELEGSHPPIALVMKVPGSPVPCITQSASSSTCSTTSSPRVRFNNSVCLVEVPSHRDLDESIHEKIWTSVDEVHENAIRNALEYNAEGRDWTKVMEEDEMVLDPTSGEYIHPVTWEEMEFEKEQEAMKLEQQRRRQEYLEKERQKRLAVQKQAKANQATAKRSNKRSPKRGRNGGASYASHFHRTGASLTRFADT